jgi:hypothetical protein
MAVYSAVPLYPPSSSSPIRLLKLSPATAVNDHIECELFCSDLDGPQTFEALSYTWGSVDNPVTISLHSTPTQITQNLAAALRHLRLPNEARILWVDALCINQADEDEKSLQVAQMRRVYTSPCTERVLVWLGEEGKACEAMSFVAKLQKAKGDVATMSSALESLFPAMSVEERRQTMARLSDRLSDAERAGMTLEEFKEQVASPTEKVYLQHSETLLGTTLRDSLGVRPLLEGYDDHWAACHELFHRPWWSRTWVLQEAIHTGKVVVHIGALAPIPIDTLCRIAIEYRRFLDVKLTSLRGAVNRLDGRQPLSSDPDFELWLRTGGTVENAASTILTSREKYASVGEAAAPRLPSLLQQLRKQDATDPRDRVYGFLGMSTNEYAIEPNYRMSKEVLYTRVARHMLARVLLVLMWVESPDREITSDGLPSWVADYTTRQSHTTLAMNARWAAFSANQNFPPPAAEGADEPHLGQSLEDRTLLVRGIRVGTLTEVRDVRITVDPELDGEDSVRLFSYKSAGRLHSIDNEDGTEGSFRNSSWGPCKAAAGDLIVVAATSTVPLVLRSAGDGGYLFVGGCWLVESEIQNIVEVSEARGFSSVMFGSACAGVEASEVEVFAIR